MELVLGIDLGTSYFKLGLFDREGRLCGLGRESVQPGDRGTSCELSIERFWWALHAGIAQALARAGARGEEIRALSYASQANSFVLLDGQGDPLTPLILWPDLRAAGLGGSEGARSVEALQALDGFCEVTGIGIDLGPEFAVAKLAWFRRHQPERWAQVRTVLTISDYLVFSLTGEPGGDTGTASLLGLWDVARGRWWPEALQAAGLAASLLPSPGAPGTLAGPVTDLGARRLGLCPGVPVIRGSLDHYVAALGAGVGPLASMSESTGTVLACVQASERYRPGQGVCTGPGFGDQGWYQLAFDANGAAALEWYRDEYASHLSLEDLLALAARVPPGCEGLRALPRADLCPGLEGFADRQAGHGHGHFVRALLESTAESLAALVDRLSPTGPPARILATGGGARSDLWLQIKADRLGTEMVRTPCPEPACRGAAMLAATGCGWYDRLADGCAAWSSVERTFVPNHG